MFDYAYSILIIDNIFSQLIGILSKAFQLQEEMFLIFLQDPLYFFQVVNLI